MEKVEKKVCIAECGLEKPITEFYKHPRMSFGVDSKCKDCVKQRTKLRHHKLMEENPNFLEEERERHKEKYHRLGYKESQKEWDKNKPWKNTSTYKNLRRTLSIPREFELHHWNYNDEYLKDVFILNIRDHKVLHRSLLLDLEKRVFYLEDGTYLDTKEKHAEYIKKQEITIIPL